MIQNELSNVQQELMRIMYDSVEEMRSSSAGDLDYLQENYGHLDCSADVVSFPLSAFVDELLKPLDELNDSQVWKEMLSGFSV